MADFCNKCAHVMWGEDFEPEIDVPQIATKLTNGYYIPVICEGCGLIAISKDEDGKVILAYGETLDGDDIAWESLDDWQEKEPKLKIN